MTKSVVLLGCGNMARALSVGAYQIDRSIHFITYTPSQTKAILLANDLNGEHLQDLSKLPEATFYLIACKPQSFSELAQSLRGKLNPNALVVSVMVGVPLEKIGTQLQVTKVIRTMPNTPTKLNSGATALYASVAVTPNEKRVVDQFFQGVGETMEVASDESVDLFGAMAGAAPAYFLNYLDKFINEYASRGVSRDDAMRVLVKTFIGSAKLLEKENLPPDVLVSQVTSKKGVTEAALKSFNDNGQDKMIRAAIDAALIRAREMSKNF